MRSIHRLTPIVALATVLVAQTASADVRTFEAPTYSNYAISYCGADGTSCGEQMATRWCRSQGYDSARDWAAVGGADDTATVRLDDGAICHGAHCDAFGQITCSRESQQMGIKLGSAARATVIAPSRRAAAVEYESAGFGVLIPGCHQTDPGVFLCETDHDYQHCRTLMRSGQVFSCRAGLAFDGGFAEPVAARPGSYVLDVDSSAEVRVEQGKRGEGRIRGKADLRISFDQPTLEYASWCLQRDSYVYHPTGPNGGLADVGDTAECDAPIRASYEPSEDDLLRAYDLCTSVGAWGDEIVDSIDVLVAALFYIDSASPQFRAEHGNKAAVIAPYRTVEAPLRIQCRD